MSQIFSQVQTNKPRTNTFNLTHDRKFSGKIGNLIPIMVMDTVPGDSVTVKGSAFVRFAPLIAPIMHRVNVYIHYYFVPNRIIWPGWQDFITGGEDGLDTTVYPYHNYTPADESPGDLADYLGLPVSTDIISGTPDVDINVMAFAAYQKIYNDYYRDQNQKTAVTDSCSDGDNVAKFTALSKLRVRAWQHDYFTSALPWTQKGAEAMLPLGTVAPVKAVNESLATSVNEQIWRVVGTTAPTGADTTAAFSIDSNSATDINNLESYIDLKDSHYADLSSATAASINDLRRAFKLQVWLERNARGGSRYNESIKIHYGVDIGDARIDRPEYIGGVKQPVAISEVLQTSNNDTQDTPQGTMVGHGVSVGSGQSFNYYCREHGYIMGIMSIMPNTAYQQGIPKHYLRSDKFDYYWPEFANIGEQPIYNKELVVDDDATYNDGIFGYIPRYSEYKFISNSVHGDMKDSLDFWHMGRKFASQTNLNNDFLECDFNEVDRVFAVQDGTDNMWCHVLNEIKAKRPMPIFGTPSTM